MSEDKQEEPTAEEKLEGHLHDIFSDLLYEVLPRHVNETLDQGFEHKREEAVDQLTEEAVTSVEDQAIALEEWEEDLEPPVCSRCGGSGGGPKPFKCPKCGGTGRP